MEGEQISGFLDGRKMAAVADNSGSQGMAFLATTYDRSLFDNVRVEPVLAQSK